MILNVLSKKRLGERYLKPKPKAFDPQLITIVGDDGNNNAIIKDGRYRHVDTYVVAESIEQVSFLQNYPQAQPFVGLEEIAAAGTTQATATQITKYIAVVTSASGSNISVKLQKANENHVQQTFIVTNRTSATINVFPAVGDSINELDVDVNVTLDPGEMKTFFVLTPLDDLEEV